MQMQSSRPNLERLQAVPLLSRLSRKELRNVLGASREIEFRKDSTIVKEASRASDLYVLLEGNAQVTIGGRKRRVLGPGDFFGEMSVLDGGPRTATVKAASHVVALRLPAEALRPLLARDSDMARKLLLVLAGRLRAGDAAPVD